MNGNRCNCVFRRNRTCLLFLELACRLHPPNHLLKSSSLFAGNLYRPGQWLSKCGLLASSIGILSELVTNTRSLAHPRPTAAQKQWQWGPVICACQDSQVILMFLKVWDPVLKSPLSHHQLWYWIKLEAAGPHPTLDSLLLALRCTTWWSQLLTYLGLPWLLDFLALGDLSLRLNKPYTQTSFLYQRCR